MYIYLKTIWSTNNPDGVIDNCKQGHSANSNIEGKVSLLILKQTHGGTGGVYASESEYKYGKKIIVCINDAAFMN